MPPHIIINETMIVSQRPEQPEKRYKILPPSEPIQLLQSKVDPQEEPLSDSTKKYRLTRSAQGDLKPDRPEPPRQQEQAYEQDFSSQKIVPARKVTQLVPPPERSSSSQRQKEPVNVQPSIAPGSRQTRSNQYDSAPIHRGQQDPFEYQNDDHQEDDYKDQAPKKRYHILTMKEKIALALKNAELQNMSMQERVPSSEDYFSGERDDGQGSIPIFQSILVSESKPTSDSSGSKRYRIVRKSDYLRIFREQSMKSQAVEDSLLDGPVYHNDLDTIGAAANPQYQRYLQFQQKMQERQNQAKDRDLPGLQPAEPAPTARQPNTAADGKGHDTFSLDTDGSKKSKHILEALKAQTHILSRLKRIKTDSVIADVSMDTRDPVPQINTDDLMTNEAIHNELLKRLQADLIMTKSSQRPKGPSQSSHLAENSLRESDILAGQGDTLGKKSTTQSNVHKIKDKPLVDYTPPGSVNASLIQHSPRQTMSISAEINLPVLSKSFINRLLTEAKKRREFAEESIHAIPELGVLFRKAGTTAPKFVTSLSQDVLSEFLSVVSNEIINAFEEVVMEEAGGIENLSRSLSANYFSRQDILNELHNSGT